MGHRWPDADPALRDSRPSRRRSRGRSRPRRRCASGATASARAPGARVPARLEAAGYERVAEHVGAARALRVLRRTATSRWRPSASPAATSLVLASDAVDLEAEKRRAAERAERAAQGDQARRGQARQPGLRRQGAGGGRRRPSATSSSSSRGSWKSSHEHVGPRPRRGAPALAGAVRHALRAGAHAAAADGARLAAGAFRAVHVVGTNGKSSTVRFTAALLEAHGVRTGSYLSPHLTSFAERIRIGDADSRRATSARRSSAPRWPRRRSTAR